MISQQAETYISRTKGWWIANTIFWVSNGSRLLMTRGTSCKQMRKTICERWSHVLHGDQTESRGDAGMRARAQRGTHDFHGKTRFLRKSTDIWLAFRYHHIKKRAPVFTNSHHTGSTEQWAYVALQQSPIDCAVLPFSSMLAWYYRDMVNNYIPF